MDRRTHSKSDKALSNIEIDNKKEYIIIDFRIQNNFSRNNRINYETRPKKRSHSKSWKRNTLTIDVMDYDEEEYDKELLGKAEYFTILNDLIRIYTCIYT